MIRYGLVAMIAFGVGFVVAAIFRVGADVRAELHDLESMWRRHP